MGRTPGRMNGGRWQRQRNNEAAGKVCRNGGEIVERRISEKQRKMKIAAERTATKKIGGK